jgi:hypothetical protein
MQFPSMRRPALIAASLALLSAFVGTSALAQVKTPAKPAPYTRLLKHDKTQLELQTRSSKFISEDGKGPAIWLVGAAHVGEATYYQSLQKLLDAQDLVLFERVNRAKPKPDPNGQPPQDPKATYQVLSDALGLQFQLIAIHYDRPTFRNSDLSWEQMSDLAAKQGKDAQQSLAGIEKLLDPNSQQGKMLVTLLTTVKNDPGMGEGMRVILAEGLAGQNGLQGTPIAAAGDIVIKARNQKVFQDLDDEIKKPTSAKSIAIFYGAGHLADMEQRLAARHYHLADSQWMTAVKADESKATGAGRMLIDAFRKQQAAAKPPRKG